MAHGCRGFVTGTGSIGMYGASAVDCKLGEAFGGNNVQWRRELFPHIPVIPKMRNPTPDRRRTCRRVPGDQGQNLRCRDSLHRTEGKASYGHQVCASLSGGRVTRSGQPSGWLLGGDEVRWTSSTESHVVEQFRICWGVGGEIRLDAAPHESGPFRDLQACANPGTLAHPRTTPCWAKPMQLPTAYKLPAGSCFSGRNPSAGLSI
jgi:hypothetical protein